MKPLGPYQTHTIPTAYIALAFRGRRDFLPWWRVSPLQRLLARRRTRNRYRSPMSVLSRSA
jgi:hypothetical protein